MKTTPPLHLAVSAHDRRRLAVDAHRSLGAVENAIDGTSKPVVALAIRAAAARLGITLPTAPARNSEPPSAA